MKIWGRSLVNQTGTMVLGAVLFLLGSCADPVKSTPVTTAMEPAELGHFQVGSSWQWLRNGEPLTIELVGMQDGVGQYESSNGCNYGQYDDFLIPETYYSNCYGYSGTTETPIHQSDLWPLQVGKKTSWTTKSRSADGETWSNHHSCEVESAEQVTVPAGTFDTYKVTCDDGVYTIRNWYAPSLKTAVLTTITRRGEGLHSKWELVSASQI